MFVLTGGSSGLGNALAKELAARGKKVLVVARRAELLETLAKTSPNLSGCCADVSTEKGRETILKALKQETTLEGLIHCAGIMGPVEPLAQIKESAFREVLETNLFAPFLLSQALLPKLEDGRILHIGSGAANAPIEGWGSYCISKTALNMLTRAWQQELPNLAFGSVKPGIVDTDMFQLAIQSDHLAQDKLDFFKELKQQQRLLQPKTVAAFLAWLLLDVSVQQFSAKEWDIYDTHHHAFWLPSSETVPPIE